MKTAEKLSWFRRYFFGLTHAYGTYDPITKKCRVVKEPVTDRVILDHLQGKQPYGVYLLVQDRTRAMVVDFDRQVPQPPIQFVHRARHYQLHAYIERSKSKGYHAWVFFAESGVPAAKARLVIQHILQEMEYPVPEIFPKQDSLNTQIQFGNFINAPLFGALVPQGKTVFVDPDRNLAPFPNQWELLETIQPVLESTLDEIITLNELTAKVEPHHSDRTVLTNGNSHAFGLPPCARQILQEGVTSFQRVTCFRLAVHFKRLGIPYDLSLTLLKQWALKNRPLSGKPIISEKEIAIQTAAAYHNDYRSCGCEDPAIIPFCNGDCPIQRKKSAIADSLSSVEIGGCIS